SLLQNGNVLIAGGASDLSNSAELYNPATGAFTATTGTMSTARSGQTATVLANGKVLITGGNSSATGADIYDPSAGTFSVSNNGMATARFGHTASLLGNGKVLVAGGSATSGGTPWATADLYDPTGNSLSATGSMK